MLTAGTHTLKTHTFENDSLNHCILVKLTDTSAKYIQEFIRKNDVNKKTLIKFSKDKGEIIFSNIKPEDQTKSFQFGLSSIKGSSKDGTASFECVSYINKRLESVSAIEEKITIQATDEAFQATKDKVTSVAEEEKKNSAIEIKSSTHNRTNRNNNSRSVTSITKPIKRLPQKSPTKTTSTTLNAHKLRETNSLDNGSLFNKIQTKPYFNNNNNNNHSSSSSSSTEHKTNVENNSENSSTLFKSEYSPYLKSNENFFQTIDSLAKKHSPPVVEKPIAKAEPKIELIKPSVVLEMKKPVEQEVKSFWDSSESISEIMKCDDLYNSNKFKDNNIRLSENKPKILDGTDDDWLKYKKINSLEDRKKLKTLFDKLYPEYLELHNYLEKENKIFSDYQERIESLRKTSLEYQQLYERVIKEYENKTSNPVYSSKNERYQEFYTKLEHFYGLIKDFDENSYKIKI